MSKKETLDQTAKRYIIGCIDSSMYIDYELKTIPEKIQFFQDTFKLEYQWKIDQVGQTKALKEYFSGLPSCCNIAFTNNDILDLAIEWGSLSTTPTEDQEFDIIENWFNLLANKTSQLFNNHHVPKD